MVPPPAPSGAVPRVFFSTTPAELILLRGTPVYSKIPGTSLLYVTNTDNDLFVNDSEKQYYVLLSGRWFRGKTCCPVFARLTVDWNKQALFSGFKTYAWKEARPPGWISVAAGRSITTVVEESHKRREQKCRLWFLWCVVAA
jgi:hypothetical protein